MRRESRGHTARLQRPYGQTPRGRRGHTARHRGHARARMRSRETAKYPNVSPRHPVRTQARETAKYPNGSPRHIHATKCPRTCSRRRFPSHVPGIWFWGRPPEHEWEIPFPSCRPRTTRRPFPGPAVSQHTSSVTILSSTATGLDIMLLALVTAYRRRLILRD